jgi:UDP:flavonoid glycosyltransferase YjiC (YdhE family)
MLLPRLIAGSPRHRYTAADNLARLTASPIYAPALFHLERELGLPRRFFRHTMGLARHSICYGFSDALLPTRVPLPPGHKLVGAWRPPAPPQWRPDARLTDFLAAGPAPVYFGFGSMGRGHADRLSHVIAKTVRRLGIRAVVQAGWAGLHAESDDIVTINECPHTWLFPRMTAAVHHSGAGTTHASLEAATPTLPVPVGFDQPFWAARLHALGLTPTAIPLKQLDSDKLTAALSRLLTHSRHRAHTRRIADVIRRQDGTAGVHRELVAGGSRA